jgi:hypothetical protein
MSGDVRTNALDDLLDAERHFRQQAECAMRELRGVLTELAERLAGTQIEDARRVDPTAPENWGPEEWRKFFRSIPTHQTGNGWYDDLYEKKAKLKGENRYLKDQLDATESPSAPVQAKDKPEMNSEILPVISTPVSPDMTALPQPTIDPVVVDIAQKDHQFSHVDLLRNLRSLRLPSALPARFENHFPKASLNEGDWERQVRRKLYVLYLISLGMDIRLEIDYLISQVEGISSRTGALRRVYDSMVDRNLISREVLEMSAPNTSLAMLRLTGDGRQLCRILGWGVVETERERLNRLHQGAQFSQHTLAVMIFAMHARFRGYQVGVLPQMEGADTNAVPDALITRKSPEDKPETVYVEVELSNKELDNKWQNLAQLQNRVALCARNAQRRARLVGDCKLKNLHGLATDLETLIACKVPDISQSTPLWAEEW